MKGGMEAEACSRIEVLAVAAAARQLALAHGVDAREAASLALVVAELGMNALLHGGGNGQVHVSVDAQGWLVCVEDEGPGLSEAVLTDAGRSDHLGRDGVREPADGHRSFGSGLAGVRRLSTGLTLENRVGGGARAQAHRNLPKSVSTSHYRGVSP